MLKITSFSNPKIKELIKLRESKQRRDTQLFIVEGLRELNRALTGNFSLKTLFFSPAVLNQNSSQLLNSIADEFKIEISEDVFAKIALRESRDGVIAVFRQKSLGIEELVLSSDPFLLVVEGLEKPGNLGALARSADGVGADAIIVISERADVYNPNCIRSSVGTIFCRPIVVCSHSEFAQFCQSRSIKIITATPDAPRSYFHSDMKGSVAIVLGSEAWGVSDVWGHMRTEAVRIPMLGSIDSLNVSVAGAILLYEALRQRIDTDSSLN